MNYDEYYKNCKKTFKGNTQDVNLYSEPVEIYEVGKFPKEYYNTVDILAEKIKSDFDNDIECSNDGVMITHNNVWKFKNEIESISNILVPYLEVNKFGCHLYVDKIYIYRTLKIPLLVSSYKWHHDNNPDEILKNLIYLTDVDENNSPFEYLQNAQKQAVAIRSFRRGTDNWESAPNSGRITESQMSARAKEGCTPKKVLAPRGTTISFLNNTIHKVNPIRSGYRDVINVRVKPTMHPAPAYVNKGWTTSYEWKGSVNKNPEIAWRSR